MKKLRGAIISACNKKILDSFFPKDLCNFYALAIYLLFSIIQMIRVSSTGLGNDFKVFFAAGELMRKGLSPYLSPDYLNGPLHALFLSLIIDFDFEFILGGLRVVSIILIPLLIWQVGLVLRVNLNSLKILSIAALIQISAFNMTLLAYGQLNVISSSLLLLAFYLVCKINDSNRKTLVNSSIFTTIAIILIDYKPHIYLLPLIYLFFLKARYIWKWTIIPSAFYIWFLSVNDFSYIREWIFNVIDRSRGQLSLGDQITIYALPLPFMLTMLFIWILVVFKMRLFQARRETWRFLLGPSSVLCVMVCLPTLFGPYVHPQDAILTYIFLMMFLLAKTNLFFSPISLLFAGMSFTWSVTVIGLLMHSLETAIIVLFISKIFRMRFRFSYILLLPAISFYVSSRFIEIGHFRSYIYVIGLHGLVALLLNHVISQKTFRQADGSG